MIPCLFIEEQKHQSDQEGPASLPLSASPSASMLFSTLMTASKSLCRPSVMQQTRHCLPQFFPGSFIHYFSSKCCRFTFSSFKSVCRMKEQVAYLKLQLYPVQKLSQNCETAVTRKIDGYLNRKGGMIEQGIDIHGRQWKI